MSPGKLTSPSLKKKAEYRVITDDLCRGLYGYIVVAWCRFRRFNEGKHSERPCVTALRSGAALLRDSGFLNISVLLPSHAAGIS